MKKKTLIFLIALIFSFIPFYGIFLKNGIIANVDFTQFFLFNPNFLERYPYAWNEYLSGTFNIFYIVNWLALALISSFFSFLGLSVLWINRFWLVFPFFLYIISVYFFIKTFLKEFNFSLLEIILFLAFAVFSPLTPQYLSLGWQEAYFLPLAGTFFMFSFFFRFLESFTFKDFIFALIFSLLSVQLMHFFIFANICFFIYIFLFKDLSLLKKVKIFFIWLVGLFFVNSWWIFPLVSSYFSNKIVNYRYNPIIDIEYLKNVISFKDVLFLNQARGTGIIQKYQLDAHIVIIRTIFPILFILGYLQAIKKKELLKKSLFLGVMTVLLIFFGAGMHPPFGKIFTWALINVPMFYMFRNIGKMGLLLSFIYGIFAVYLFKKFSAKSNSRKILGTLVIFIFLSVSSYPLITGNLMGDLQPLKLPDEYLEINSVINNSKQDFKVLNLPMPEWCSMFSWMEDKEKGAQIFNPFYSLLNKPIIFDELRNTGLNSVQKLSVFLACKGDQKQLKLLPLLNIGKLIFQKDQLNKPVEFCSNEELLKKVDTVFFKEKTGNFVNLYSLPDEYFLPHFYIPQNTIYSPNDIEILPNILGFDDYEIRSAIYLQEEQKLGNSLASLAEIEKLEDKEKEKLENRANEIFVKGENKKLGNSLASLAEIEKLEIFYPHVKYEPGSLKWEAALLKEKYDKWQARKEPEKLIEKHLFYASKRINEIEKWGNLEISSPLAREIHFADIKNADNTDEKRITLTEMWEKDLEEAIGLLEKIQEEEKRTEWAIKIKRNIKDNEQKLGNSLASLAEIEKLEEKLDEYIPKLDIGKREYEIEIPKAGNYSLLIKGMGNEEKLGNSSRQGGTEIKKLEIDGEKIADNALNADNTDIGADKADRKTDNADGGWREWGEINLEEGKHVLTLRFGEIQNLLKYAPVGRNMVAFGDRNSVATQPEIKKLEIDEWQEDQWYQVKGKYEIKDGEARLIIEERKEKEEKLGNSLASLAEIEKLEDKEEEQKFGNSSRQGGTEIEKLEDKEKEEKLGNSLASLAEIEKLGKFEISKEIILTAEDEEFEFFIKADPKALAAQISLVPSEEAKIILEDLRVEPVWEPEIVLRNKKEQKLGNSLASLAEIKKLPKITFAKVNPTKYRIKVEGAKEPYTLVFSESFHEGWKIYLKEEKKLGNSLASLAEIEKLEDKEEEEKLGNSLASLAEIKKLGNWGAEKLGEAARGITDLFFDNKGYGEEVASYFDGQIKEGTHRNTFLEPATFETWGKEPIAQDNHLLVNGYANSWYINPSQVCENADNADRKNTDKADEKSADKADICASNADGSYDMELIVEFWPQRLFYIGLFISGLTLVGCLGYLGYETIKKRN